MHATARGCFVRARRCRAPSRCRQGHKLDGINCNGKAPIDLAMQEQHQELTAILVEAIAAKTASDAAGRQVFEAAKVGDVPKLGPLLKTWTGNQDVLN